MRYIFEWNKFNPDSKEVEKWESVIYSKFPIKSHRGDKYVLVDDKPYYLTGNFIRKNELVNKISIILSDNKTHLPSLRRAIKNWFDKNSKI